MLVEVTYACKMGCTHCLSDCKPDGEHMTLEVFEDVLKFMIKNQIPTWSFSGGEMFEHPDILKMLSLIESYWKTLPIKYPITFATNGRELVRYENGARNPKVSMIFRIANALDVNAAALYDPTPCDDLSTMFFFFEMEEKYGMTIKKIVDDDGNVKYAVVANSENRMYDYLSKWQDAYICKKIESKLVDTQEEMERILEDYARWKSKFPKSIENSKDLKENQKQKLKKKIEELQSEYERLH